MISIHCIYSMSFFFLFAQIYLYWLKNFLMIPSARHSQLFILVKTKKHKQDLVSSAVDRWGDFPVILFPFWARVILNVPAVKFSFLCIWGHCLSYSSVWCATWINLYALTGSKRTWLSRLNLYQYIFAPIRVSFFSRIIFHVWNYLCDFLMVLFICFFSSFSFSSSFFFFLAMLLYIYYLIFFLFFFFFFFVYFLATKGECFSSDCF